MATSEKPVFLVNAYSDPAILRISGRASFLNCAPVRDFFDYLSKHDIRHVVIDFAECTGMDSTFLGILAGAALEFRKLDPPGMLTLVRLNERNQELVRNLGLHRILDVRENTGIPDKSEVEALAEDELEEDDRAKVMLKAHEDLVRADEGNLKKFEDVLSFLRMQAGK